MALSKGYGSARFIEFTNIDGTLIERLEASETCKLGARPEKHGGRLCYAVSNLVNGTWVTETATFNVGSETGNYWLGWI